MKAYLLAAGYATRMHPVTRDRPKPLLEVAGAPILSHILDGVLGLEGLSEVVVIGNHRFATHFAEWARETSAPVPVTVLDDGTTNDDDKLGAIGDIGFALERVPPKDEPWLVAAGDNLLGFPMRALQREFEVDAGCPLLTVRRVSRDGPSRYNEVTTEGDRVTGFREKPADPRTDLAAIALYFFPAGVAERVGEYLAQGGNPDAPGHFVAWLVERVPTRAAMIPGEWFDIGSLEGLEHTRRHYRPPASFREPRPAGRTTHRG